MPLPQDWWLGSVHKFLSTIAIVLYALLWTIASANAADEFRFPKYIAQDLDTAFAALQKSDWHESRRLADALISEYEERLSSAASERDTKDLLRALKATSIMSAIARYQTNDLAGLSETLIKRQTWHKRTSEDRPEAFNGILDVQFHLNQFVVDVLSENLSVSLEHLTRANAIADNLPSADSTDEGGMYFLFHAMRKIAGYLYIQRTGSLPPGRQWLDPIAMNAGSGINIAMSQISELMRSVALSRLGRLDAAKEILQTFRLKENENDHIRFIVLFHKGCLLASEGDKSGAIKLLHDAEMAARKAGQLLPISAMISASNESGGKSIWPPELVPTSDDYLLKIVPHFKLNIDFDFVSYDGQQLPGDFKGQFGPGFFLRLSA